MMNAKQYSESRGFPLVTLRRLLRTQAIPNNQVGRVYYFDETVADEYFKAAAERPTTITQTKSAKKLSWIETLEANKAAILGF